MSNQKTLSAPQQAILNKYEQMMLSHEHINAKHKIIFKNFLIETASQEPLKYTGQKLLEWWLKYWRKRDFDRVAYNDMLQALKFYYITVAKQEEFRDILPRERKENTKKNILSRGQVELLFSGEYSQKKLCILYLLYHYGLRPKELIGIQTKDIDLEKGTLTVNRRGENTITIRMKEHIVKSFKDYKEQSNTSLYLFPTQRKKQYSTESLCATIKEIGEGIIIECNLTPTILRDSSIVHCMESQISLSYLNRIFGFSDTKKYKLYKRFMVEHHPKWPMV